ncbi:MFS transporter [Pseudorhodoferax sp.]|uniref:MFS transporter n=1 Tax=Pseudorhodoferax sp. TaxID=1993553 RepID=UPI002DD63A65|nr:MFS transporter [Pseudorhodoferax sp.]
MARSAALQRRQVLVLLTALSALAFMDRQIIAVLIQPVKAEFGLSDLQIGLVTGLGYALTFALIGVPLGRRADRGGRRNLVAWCRGLGGLLAALGGAASGFWTLMASRAGGAISDAGAAPASMSMLADLYPPEQRSRAMSVFGTGGSIGALLAMVVGAWLAQRYGWRATVVLVGSSTLGLSALLRFGVTEPARAAVPTAPAALAAAELQGGAVGAIWREPVTRWLIVAAACALLAGYAFGTWNTALLVRRHGLSLQGAGWVSGTAALASVLGGLAAGALTDHLARRDLRWQIGVPMLGVGIALPCALAYLALPVGAIAPAVALVTAFAFFITWWAAPAYAALSLIVPPQRRATASAMLMLAGAVLASGLGPILTGGLSDVLEARLPGDGLRIALACMVGMLLPGLFAFARVRATYPAAHRALHPAALPR